MHKNHSCKALTTLGELNGLCMHNNYPKYWSLLRQEQYRELMICLTARPKFRHAEFGVSSSKDQHKRYWTLGLGWSQDDCLVVGLQAFLGKKFAGQPPSNHLETILPSNCRWIWAGSFRFLTTHEAVRNLNFQLTTIYANPMHKACSQPLGCVVVWGLYDMHNI